MGLRGRLGKLERELDAQYALLYLPDGTQVRYTGEDALDALVACMEGEEHWLLPVLRAADKSERLPGLIWALEAPLEEVAGDA